MNHSKESDIHNLVDKPENEEGVEELKSVGTTELNASSSYRKTDTFEKDKSPRLLQTEKQTKESKQDVLEHTNTLS